MNSHNLRNIQDIFEVETGVTLPRRRAVRHPVRAALLCAALLICCFATTAVASGLFSAVAGDDLSFHAVYEGDGVLSIEVENRSNKVLEFQPKLILRRWAADETIEPLSDDLIFTGTRIAPHSTGTMTIDLSRAYDVELLEQPLTDDHYYLILTNNSFRFGHDWICSVTFAEPIITPVEETLPPQSDDAIVENIMEEFQAYFENVTYDILARHALNMEYLQKCEELFAHFDGTIVHAVSPYVLVEDDPAPFLFDDTVPADEQKYLVGLHRHSQDVNFKVLGSQMEETALTISADIPSAKYEGSGTYLPLLYVFTYEKEATEQEGSYAFLYGQLLTFSELEQYKVYEDDQYVCYEASALIYSDLRTYTENFMAQNPDLRFDEQVWARIENVYNYFSEHMVVYFPEL